MSCDDLADERRACRAPSSQRWLGWSRRVLSLALVAWTSPVRAEDEGGRTPATVEIALVGPAAALASVREVTGELLSRDGVVADWRELDWLRAEDILETGIGRQGAPMFLWIDVSSPTEARLYFRAAAGQRFVIRRIPLPGRIGPVEVEEIAQIVQSVLRALVADTGWALSLPEARATLQAPERPPAPAAPPPAWPPRLEVGSAVVGQSYASELAFTGEVEVSIAAWSPRALGGGLSLGYGWPARFSSGAVGAELQAATVRVELLWEPVRVGRWAVRLGAGLGADRVTYTPRAESPGATAVAGGSFLSPLGCLDAAVHLDVAPRFALALGFLAQVYLKRVHYDVTDPDGALEEVLVPHRLRPAVTLGGEVRL
jgi:hypothetical protein